ncbi:hypothetical protein JCM9279_004032 [Rhodotorula babjevae]
MPSFRRRPRSSASRRPACSSLATSATGYGRRVYYRPADGALPRSYRHGRGLQELCDVDDGGDLPLTRIHVGGVLSTRSKHIDPYTAAIKAGKECWALYHLLHTELDHPCRPLTAVKLSNLVLPRDVADLLLGQLSLMPLKCLSLDNVQIVQTGDDTKPKTFGPRYPLTTTCLKNLQILTSDETFLDLVRSATHLDSLALDPGVLPLEPLYLKDVCQQVGKLNKLSFRAAGGGEGVRKLLMHLITTASTTRPHRLQELALEGPVELALVAAVARDLPSLTRLSLLHTGEMSVELFERLAVAAPRLEALTVRVGDGESTFAWPGGPGPYLDILPLWSKLQYLAVDLTLALTLGPPQLTKDDQEVVRLTKIELRRALEAVGHACPALSELLIIEDETVDGLYGLGATISYHRNTRRLKTVIEHKLVDELKLMHLEWFESA